MRVKDCPFVMVCDRPAAVRIVCAPFALVTIAEPYPVVLDIRKVNIFPAGTVLVMFGRVMSWFVPVHAMTLSAKSAV